MADQRASWRLPAKVSRSSLDETAQLRARGRGAVKGARDRPSAWGAAVIAEPVGPIRRSLERSTSLHYLSANVGHFERAFFKVILSKFEMTKS